ncbi:hypothetical protein FWG95_02380 [Candidatus Saccharibacteria bacterium]|nr:hypothetical protein [Candidatus Saccharibacteria bacterium]
MADNEKLRDNSAERLEYSKGELENAQKERLKSLEKERRPDNRNERMESAKAELEQQFKGEKQGNKVRQPKQSAPAPIKKATQKQKEDTYRKTLQTIQKDMNPVERTFSKIIHNPVVEKTSEVVGNTVARPAQLLAGALAALILTAVVYIIAKHYGYLLSGFEWIATFLIGWVIGLVVDWVRVGLLGKKAGPA